MPAKPQGKIAILKRRQKVAELYLQGWTQTAIGEHVGITQPTVCQDIKAVRALWQQSAVRDFDLARQEELERLAIVEREAWAAWERSQKPAQEARVKDSDPARAHKTMKTKHGDTRCLEVVLKCIASRRDLLGLDLAPPTVELHAHAHSHDVASLSVEERRKRLLEIMARLSQRAGVGDAGAAAGGDEPDGVCTDRQPGTLETGPTLDVS